MPKRKNFTADQKAQIVLEMLREDKSVAQIATENSTHPNQLHCWKKQALENFPQLFEEDRKGEKTRPATPDLPVFAPYRHRFVPQSCLGD